MSDIPVGTVVGGVRIDAVAGRGGMGVVYRGSQVALRRTVALKVVRAELADDPEFRERFAQESEIAASLDHPHVVPVLSAGEDGGRLYVVMRFVEGTDLRAAVRARGRLDPATAAAVVAQIGSALDAAHRRGLVHRDVKPANVLLADGADGPHAFLTDFGLSRHLESAGLTRAGTVVGTPDYLAPEQLGGSGPVDGRVDVYALGCVLHQALTGQVPFPRDTEHAKLWAHMTEPPPRPTAVVPGLPAGLDEVIARALAKRPEERYATAGELGRAAVAAVSHSGAQPAAPVWAGAPGAPGGDGPSGPFARPAPVGAGWAGGFGPQAGPAGPPSHPSAPLPVPAPPPRRHGGRIVAVVLGVALVLAVLTGTLISRQGGGGIAAPPAAAPVAPAGVVTGAPIAVGKEPLDVEAGEGFVWVAGSGDGTVTKVDPATGAATPITVGGVPTELVVTPGAVWVWNYSDGVTRVDVATGAVGYAVNPNGTGDITGIAAGGGYLWLSHSSSNSVSRIDLATGAPTGTPTTVGAAPIGLAFGTRSLFVVNDGDRTLSVVDGSTGAVSGDPIALGDAAGGVAVEDGTIYVGTTGDVTPIDEASLVVGDPIPLKGGSLFLAGSDGIWVAFPLADEVRWLDLRGQENRGGPVTGVGKGAGDLELHDGDVWISNTAEGTVVRVATS